MTPGARRRRNRVERGDLPVNAEINITSLIDVAFTLLVIFLITAPILRAGLEVEVPRADVDPVTTPQDPFWVSIRPDGSIWIGDETQVGIADFEQSFSQLVQAARPEVIYVQGDSTAAYGPVARVMATVNRVSMDQGIRWALVMYPEVGPRN